MLEEKRIRQIIESVLGHQDRNTIDLVLMLRDIVSGDRMIIRVLNRNIESLTIQMKTVTDVTFQRDTCYRALERQMDINNHLRERLAKYE